MTWKSWNLVWIFQFWHMTWKFHDLNLCKIHVMFQHGKKIKPGQITWNSHGIQCQFRWQTAVDFWREMTWNFHENTYIFYWVFLWFTRKNLWGIFFVIGLYKIWHGFPWKFHVILYHKSTAVWPKLTPNSMTIPRHLSRFYLFSMKKHDMDFGQVRVMEFPWHLLRKWWDFHWIWSHFWPNLRQKDTGKSQSHFWQGCSIVTWLYSLL